MSVPLPRRCPPDTRSTNSFWIHLMAACFGVQGHLIFSAVEKHLLSIVFHICCTYTRSNKELQTPTSRVTLRSAVMSLKAGVLQMGKKRLQSRYLSGLSPFGVATGRPSDPKTSPREDAKPSRKTDEGGIGRPSRRATRPGGSVREGVRQGEGDNMLRDEEPRLGRIQVMTLLVSKI